MSIKKQLTSISIFLVTIVTIFALNYNLSGQAQPDILKLNWLMTRSINSNANNIDHGAVHLDGYSLFLVSTPISNQKVPLEQRVKGIEAELQYAVDHNAEPETIPITVTVDPVSDQPVISINDRYLMTVTDLDAQLQGRDRQGWATQITQIIRDALIRAKLERQPSHLLWQGGIAIAIILSILVLNRLVKRWQNQIANQKKLLQEQISQASQTLSEQANAEAVPETDISSEMTASKLQLQLTQRQQLNLKDFQKRALQIAYWLTLVAGIFMVLGLFPYTRWLQSFLLSTPLQVIAIAIATYLLARISELLIDRFTGFLKAKDFSLLTPYQRLDLRVSTVSNVLKNITGLLWASLGLLACLSAIGVDLIPLLAGAGIIGLAISFAAQSLIKDVINGFLIILEDQYAVGDVITVGNMGGLVENMNLRITQVRNGEGQLITIPNSAISVVQNLSKDWSRVDLMVRIAYDTDPDYALEVFKQLAADIYQEPDWSAKIIEMPEVLGIDELQNDGMLIRIWIKTKPLQQWSVAREFRRRLRLTMQQKEIAIGIPHQALLVDRWRQTNSSDRQGFADEAIRDNTNALN
ncbi:MAG: mechanosensitive ion channel family protein [Pseudanabaenaceae cyanobacterium bins.39]|nr:mechanosensitive ion channel family protein [Pseudanabaenaceae cyanobacterium bins.39]